MTNKTKQSAKNAHFSKRAELTNAFMKKFRSDALAVFTDNREPVAFGWKPRDMRDEVETLVNRQVLEALAEVKSKKKVCDTFHSFGITKRIDAVPLSAIEEIESKYQ